MSRVAVVGAGVSGLVAARDLEQAGHEVTVWDPAPRPGGKLRASQIAGVSVDEGAESLLVRAPEGVELADSLGLALVHPATMGARLLVGGRLQLLPAATLLGVPTSLRGLRPVLGAAGVARAAVDLIAPALPVAADPTVAELVGTRLGRRVIDRLVDPLLGGVYAGSADDLAVSMAAPVLRDPGRSLLRTARARRPAPGGDGPVFGSVAGGLGALASALAASLEAQWRLGTAVRRLSAGTGGFTVEGEQFDAVVLAVPGAPAARLLRGLVPDAVLPVVPYASVAIVTLVLSEPPPLAGSGFLVAAGERRVVKAVTLFSQKWGWAPDLPVVVRASVGRYGEGADLVRDDVELAGVVAAEICDITGFRGRVLASRLTRWEAALPQYRPGHPERTLALRRSLPARLVVAGAAYDGVGIPACIRSGRSAARDLCEALVGD